MSGGDFWARRAEADAKIKEHGLLTGVVSEFRKVEEALDKAKTSGKEMDYFDARRIFRALEIKSLFTGRYDAEGAIISVYPGAGGDDAEDWARMLFEMFMKYAERRKWKTETLDTSPNRRSFEIKAEHAYGFMKGERGVHRLVRISPFSAKKLRHTSFALVEVLPDLPEVDEAQFQIPEKDLKVEFFRSSGPGGQNVNKVETAVRITHVPTGLTVSAQAERSQSQNRERALKLLKAKLIQRMEDEHVEEVGKLRTVVKPEWGSQIRSYVVHPYHMVKDHRTNVETSQTEKVLEGDLEPFIEADIEMLRDK